MQSETSNLPQPKRVRVLGLRCQSCALRVERALQDLAGVYRAEVSYASESALVWGEVSTDTIIATIQRAGYGASEGGTHAESALSYALPLELWLLLGLMVPFLVGMVGMAFGSHVLMLNETVQLLLAWLVQSAFAVPFYRGAWAALQAKTATMDTLVALGTTVTLLYSTWAWWTGIDAVYFEASVMVVALVRLGKHVETQTKHHSLNALSALLKLYPQQVYRLGEQGAHDGALVDLSAVKVGEVLRARMGERIGADGIVLAGSGRVDESHLTGESALLSKQRGDAVLAGALVVEGSLDYRVNKLGQATLLGDLLTALDHAQNSKAPMARLADKVAAWFVPAVVGVALLTFWLTSDMQSALVNAAAVLVVACPCALGLAVPASVMVGLGRAVQAGVWFRDGAALEGAARMDTVVFDKTGTLTEGRPQVVAVWLGEQSALPVVLQYAASLEIHAQHPVAGAILAYAQCENLLSVTELENVAGAGIAGTIDGQRVQLGTAAWLGVTLPEAAQFDGKTVVAMTVDKALWAVFALSDAPKLGAAAAVSQLHALGLQPVMLSGDREDAVAWVAAQLHIDDFAAAQSPRDKAERIKALCAAGRNVAMVGDGVNDVAALSAADCGVAFYHGAAVASAVSEVRLMQADMAAVVAVFTIARQTVRNIYQNLALAMIYNATMIPLAALGYLTPALAGMAMALSSLAVLGNALRLKPVKT